MKGKLAWVLLLAVSSAQAETPSLVDTIFQDVSVASRKSERVTDAPGVVSVLTAEDLHRLPFETLADVLQTVPGLNLTESFYGITSLSFRGVQEEHYNTRSLLLLNGVPMRDATVGGGWLEAVPVNAVERIEIIRGPGSVLYGDGAFAGVINIVTKEPPRGLRGEAWGQGGSRRSREGRVLAGAGSDDAGVWAAATNRYSDGYRAIARDEKGLTGQVGAYPGDPKANQNNFENEFIQAAKGPFRLEAFHFHQDKDKFGVLPELDTTGAAINEAGGAALRGQGRLGSFDLSGDVHGGSNRSRGDMNFYQLGVLGFNGHTTYSGWNGGGELNARWNADRGSLLAGVSADRLETDPYIFTDARFGTMTPFSPFVKSHSTSDESVYAQADAEALPRVRVVAGLRGNHNAQYGNAWVPRTAVVWKTTDDLTVKALYGSAYRNPTFFEKYVNAQNVVYGDPDLKPEKTNSAELSTDWTHGRTLCRLTAFSQDIRNRIGRFRTYAPGEVPAVSLLETRPLSTVPVLPTPGYDNGAGVRLSGVEAEARGTVFADRLFWTVSGGWKDGRDNVTKRTVDYLDRFLAHGDATVRTGRLMNTLSADYVGPRKGHIDDNPFYIVTPGLVKGQSVVVPSRTRFDYKGAVSIGRWEFFVQAMNLFKTRVLYPESIRARIETVPGDGNRRFYAGLSVALP